MMQAKTMVLILPMAGACVLGEQLRRLHGVGAVLIIVGIACVLAGD